MQLEAKAQSCLLGKLCWSGSRDRGPVGTGGDWRKSPAWMRGEVGAGEALEEPVLGSATTTTGVLPGAEF